MLFPKTFCLFLTSIFLLNALSPEWVLASARPGEIRQVDVTDGTLTTTVTIHGENLGKCQPILVRDAHGSRPPTLLLPFSNTGVAAVTPNARSARGAVSSVDVVALDADPEPLAQVLIGLVADSSYKLKRNGNTVVVEIQKVAGAAAPKMSLDEASLGFSKGYQRQEIQPGDMLYISVSPAEELSRDLAVDQDGKIFIPIVGAVSAAGQSSDTLARKLTLLLSKYVTNPKVDVLIKQFSAQQISMMGQVRQPGSYPYRPNVRLLDMVSMAGGFGPAANKTQIHIYRGSGASRKVTIVDVQEALKTGDITKDFLLQPGDLIDVPKGVSPLTIFGDVPHGGNFEFFKDMRLLDLVALCQGLGEGANEKKIKIFRGEAPNQKVLTVRFDDVMQGKQSSNLLLAPGDIVYVPRRALWTYSALANTLLPFTTIILAASTIALVLKK